MCITPHQRSRVAALPIAGGSATPQKSDLLASSPLCELRSLRRRPSRHTPRRATGNGRQCDPPNQISWPLLLFVRLGARAKAPAGTGLEGLSAAGGSANPQKSRLVPSSPLCEARSRWWAQVPRRRTSRNRARGLVGRTNPPNLGLAVLPSSRSSGEILELYRSVGWRRAGEGLL